MSIFSDTREAFMGGDYDSYEDDRYRIRRERDDENEAEEPDFTYEATGNPIKDFFGRRKMRKAENKHYDEMLDAEEQDSYQDTYKDDYKDDYDDRFGGIFGKSRRAKTQADYNSEKKARTEKSRTSRTESFFRSNSFSRDDFETEIEVFYPNTIDDCDEVVDAVKEGKIAIIIFEEGPDAINPEASINGNARRIVDYIGGAGQGMDCDFSKFSNGIFCIAPQNIKIPVEKDRRPIR